MEALRELYADDAVVWHNYDEKDVPASTTEAALRGLHDAVTDLDWEDVAVQTTESGFVWQAIITGTAPGGSLHAHTCVVATVDDGRISRIEEYLDPSGFAVLRG